MKLQHKSRFVWRSIYIWQGDDAMSSNFTERAAAGPPATKNTEHTDYRNI